MSFTIFTVMKKNRNYPKSSGSKRIGTLIFLAAFPGGEKTLAGNLSGFNCGKEDVSIDFRVNVFLPINPSEGSIRCFFCRADGSISFASMPFAKFRENECKLWKQAAGVCY